MTEAKSLTQDQPSSALELSDEAKEFLTSPYRAKLLTEFSIGSNKLQLFGSPLIMAQYSELIKTTIPSIAESPAPHALLTHGVVLERPMTALWLEYNGYYVNLRQFSMNELLHMYRLAGYFGFTKDLIEAISINVMVTQPEPGKKLSENDIKTLDRIITSPEMPYHIPVSNLTKFYRTIQKLDLDPKYTSILATNILGHFVIDGYKGELTDEDYKLIAELFNRFFSQPDKVDYKPFIDKQFLTEDPETSTVQRVALRNIFNVLSKYPETQQAVNYIPVYIDSIVETYAERKSPPGTLGRLNTEWKYDGIENFSKMDYTHDVLVNLKVAQWNTTGINLIIDTPYNIDELLSEGIVLNPILA